MTARQLRLLGILGLKHITDAVEQLDIALLGVRLESRDESPGHGTRGLGRDSCVGTAELNESVSLTYTKAKKGNSRSLIILATTPHNDIGGRGLGPLGILIGLIATSKHRLGDSEYAAGDTPHVTAGVRANGAEKTRAGLLGEVGLLENTFGAVDVGQVHDGARVAAIEDGRQTHSSLERLDDVVVDFVVDDVPVCLVVDWVDDFVVAIFLVAVEVFGLAAVSCLRGTGLVQVSRKDLAVDTYQSNAKIAHRWAGR